MRYLLGQLTEQETAEFEAQCFQDDGLFHEMTDLENDLLHSYVRGELSMAEQKEFEAGYLTSPARRRKVEFVQALEHHLFGSGREERGLTKWPARAGFAVQSWQGRVVSGAIALVVLATISWLAIINYRLKNELRQMQVQQAELRQQQRQLEAQLAALSSRLQESAANSHHVPQLPQRPQPVAIAFNVAPGLPRSADGIQQFAAPPRGVLIKLNLYLEDDKYTSYRAWLVTPSEKQLWRKAGLKSRVDTQGRQIVTCEIPSDVLGSGDYLVRLDGVAETGNVEKDITAYRFAVAGR
jgi:anti-sigma factor RsiW